jgi:type II secretory pathway component GspD/PulD (secretin)
MHPGDYAAVVHALDTINNGRSVIKSTVVVSNNAKAEINGVVQEPLVATNSTNTVATTSISGTDDAGTQITITPQISAADYVTLTYAITQSAFNGAPTQTNTGTPIPPEKTANTVSSVATIPDGFVIALGGLVTRTTGRSETRIPLLGSIPFLGALFRSTSDTDSDSRFYVFIHASVLRHAAFADLRHSSDVSADEAELHDKSWPQLTPRFIK